MDGSFYYWTYIFIYFAGCFEELRDYCMRLQSTLLHSFFILFFSGLTYGRVLLQQVWRADCNASCKSINRWGLLHFWLMDGEAWRYGRGLQQEILWYFKVKIDSIKIHAKAPASFGLMQPACPICLSAQHIPFGSWVWFEKMISLTCLLSVSYFMLAPICF
jgi:hypothetical protein